MYGFRGYSTNLLSVNSYVKYKGLTSETFPIQQGTRQGNKSSPLLYLLYINGLIKELEASKLGMCMYWLRPLNDVDMKFQLR